jgi:hypothetical protein
MFNGLQDSAVVRVTRNQSGPSVSAQNHGLSGVQTESAFLFIRSVTTRAMSQENRTNGPFKKGGRFLVCAGGLKQGCQGKDPDPEQVYHQMCANQAVHIRPI